MMNPKIIIIDGDVCWMEDENGERQGPFCTACFNNLKELVLMDAFINDKYECPNCFKTTYLEGK